MESKITVRKLTDVGILRMANSYTSGRESLMNLKTAYRLMHSPVRTQMFLVEMQRIPLFVASQLVRSKVGVEWWMRTRRTDRGAESFKDVCEELALNLYDRGDDPVTEILDWPNRFDRYAPTDLMGLLNAEAIINMSHKRLCSKASKETREVWEEVCNQIRLCDPDLYPHLVRPCVAMGVCREKCCGFIRSQLFTKLREEYKRNFIDI